VGAVVVIGIGILWAGYAVAYYGFNRITGGNDSFASLVWPGRYNATARDGAAT
jgi:hypothetical protein